MVKSQFLGLYCATALLASQLIMTTSLVADELSWHQVDLLDPAPASCTKGEEVEMNSSRLFVSVSNAALKEKVIAKLKILAAEKGNNALQLTDEVWTYWALNLRATTFSCPDGAAKNFSLNSDTYSPGSRLLAQHQPRNSKLYRQNRTYFGAIDYGLGVAPARTFGVTLGCFLVADQIAELSFLEGKGEEERVAFSLLHDASAASIKLRWFFGNSVFVNSGIGVRRYKLSFKSTELNQIRYATTADSFIFDLSVGNLWQIDRFSFGITWVGIMIKMLDISSEETINDPSFLSEQAGYVVDAKRDVSSVTPQIGRLTIGYAF